jgi:hypothetical protein
MHFTNTPQFLRVLNYTCTLSSIIDRGFSSHATLLLTLFYAAQRELTGRAALDPENIQDNIADALDDVKENAEKTLNKLQGKEEEVEHEVDENTKGLRKRLRRISRRAKRRLG